MKKLIEIYREFTSFSDDLVGRLNKLVFLMMWILFIKLEYIIALEYVAWGILIMSIGAYLNKLFDNKKKNKEENK